MENSLPEPDSERLISVRAADEIIERWKRNAENKTSVINRLYARIESVKGILNDPQKPDTEKLAAIRKELP